MVSGIETQHGGRLTGKDLLLLMKFIYEDLPLTLQIAPLSKE